MKTYKEVREAKKPEPKKSGEIDKALLDKLRKSYDSVERINPTGPAWKKVEAFIDKREPDQLKGLAYAKIKWISIAAADKLRTKYKIKLKASEYM